MSGVNLIVPLPMRTRSIWLMGVTMPLNLINPELFRGVAGKALPLLSPGVATLPARDLYRPASVHPKAVFMQGDGQEYPARRSRPREPGWKSCFEALRSVTSRIHKSSSSPPNNATPFRSSLKGLFLSVLSSVSTWQSLSAMSEIARRLRLHGKVEK